MREVWVVGHVSRDTVKVAGAPTRHLPGGVAHYAAITYRRLGLACAVLTKIDPADTNTCLSPLYSAGVDVEMHHSATTTSFANSYADIGAGSRHQRVGSVAAPFTVDDLTGLRGRCIHLGPLTAADLPLDVIRAVRPGFDTVILDAQGCLREINDGEVVQHPWPDAASALPVIDIVKTNRAEAALFCGCDDPVAAAHAFAAHGAREVIVTLGDRGAVILADGVLHKIDGIAPRRMVDPTGCGDTFLAAYAARRLAGESAPCAGAFAATAATIKIESAGALKADLDQVRERMNG